MRNLKKVLALVLALVMSLSLVTIATASDFADADDIPYEEAVDVMTAVGVLNGLETGAFNPKGTLTREQAAKIICTMLLGQSNAEKLGVTNSGFSDVAATRWSAPYIAYCSSMGIVVGNGDGTFNPTGKLTGYAFGKMLLVALGFEGEYTGSSWTINVAKDLVTAELDEGLDLVLSADLSREEAAQLGLNALKYTSSEDIYVVGNGTDTFEFDNQNDALLYATLMKGNKDEGDPSWGVTKTKDYSDALIADVFEVEVDDGFDAFGRPSTTYNNDDWDGELRYADAADYTFVIDEATTLGDLIDDNKLDKKITSGFTAEEALAVGQVVELYVDSDTKALTAHAVYSYALDKITDVTACDEDDDEDAIAVGAEYIVELENEGEVYDIQLAGFDVNGYVEDAYIVYAVDADGNAVMNDYTYADYEVYADTAVADTIEGKVTATGTGYVRVDGDKYVLVDGVTATLSGEYTFFLDPNGIVVATDVIDDSATINDVVYAVKAFDKDSTNDYGVTTTETYLQVVKLDGTVENILVGTKQGEGTQYGVGLTAAADLEDGVYTAKYYSSEKTIDGVKYKKCYKMNEWPAAGSDDYYTGTIAAATELKSSDTRVTGSLGTIRLNSSTTYVLIEDSLADIEVTTKTGGVTTDLAAQGTVITTKETGNYVASYVILPGSEVKATSYDDVIYVDANADVESVVVGDDEIACVQFNAYDEAGKAVKITREGDAIADSGFYTYSVDDNGIYELEEIVNLSTGEDALTADYDDETGRITGTYASYYGTLLTLAEEHMVDIDTADATIIDIRDTNADGQYNKTVTTLAAMQTAVEKKADGVVIGYEVSLDMYVDDGAVLIVVTDISVGD